MYGPYVHCTPDLGGGHVGWDIVIQEVVENDNEEGTIHISLFQSNLQPHLPELEAQQTARTRKRPSSKQNKRQFPGSPARVSEVLSRVDSWKVFHLSVFSIKL